MPKHYAIDANVQHYTVEFHNTKTVKLVFDHTFDKVPMIQVTPGDSGNFPIYKTAASTTSCKIRCKSKWNGEVDVIVMERNLNA